MSLAHLFIHGFLYTLNLLSALSMFSFPILPLIVSTYLYAPCGSAPHFLNFGALLGPHAYSQPTSFAAFCKFHSHSTSVPGI